MPRRTVVVLVALAALLLGAAWTADAIRLPKVLNGERQQQSLQQSHATTKSGVSSRQEGVQQQPSQKQPQSQQQGNQQVQQGQDQQQGSSSKTATGSQERGLPDGGGIVEGSGAADLSVLETPADLSHLPEGAAAAEAKSRALLEMLGPDMPLHAVATDISFIGFGLERDDQGAELRESARPAVIVGVHEVVKRDTVLAAVRTAVSDEHVLVQAFAMSYELFPEETQSHAVSLLEAEAEAEAEVGAGSWYGRDRPIRGGSSISRCALNNAGTLGGFLTKAGSPGIRYGVTNMHVLGVPGGAAPYTAAVPAADRKICQPGTMDGGRAPLAAFGQFKAGLFNIFNANGNMDIAVFKVDRGGSNLGQTRCSLHADHAGGPYAIAGVANIAVGNAVHKFGRKTEHTRSNVAMTGAVVMAGTPRGNIIAINLANTLGAARATAGTGAAVPGNPFGWSGDSGAFYVRRAPGNPANRFNVVGMNGGRTVVGATTYVYGYTIAHVLGTINANGLTNGAIPAGDLPLTVCTSNPRNL